jgi:hypothetical protein
MPGPRFEELRHSMIGAISLAGESENYVVRYVKVTVRYGVRVTQGPLRDFRSRPYADTLNLAHRGAGLLSGLGEASLQSGGYPSRAQHRGGPATINASAVPIPGWHPPPDLWRWEDTHFRRCRTWRRLAIVS